MIVPPPAGRRHLANVSPGSSGGAPIALNWKWPPSFQLTEPTIGGWSGGERARTSLSNVAVPWNCRDWPWSLTFQVKPFCPSSESVIATSFAGEAVHEPARFAGTGPAGIAGPDGLVAAGAALFVGAALSAAAVTVGAGAGWSDGGGVAFRGDALASVWRREDGIYAVSGPKAETRIGTGHDPALAQGDAGVDVAWVAAGGLVLRQADAQDRTLGPGRFPALLAMRASTVGR